MNLKKIASTSNTVSFLNTAAGRSLLGALVGGTAGYLVDSNQENVPMLTEDEFNTRRNLGTLSGALIGASTGYVSQGVFPNVQ